MEGPYALHAQRVLREAELNRPANTTAAYVPKKAEFRGFCEAVWSGTPYPFLVTEEKMFGFLYYNSYRSHYDKKKRKRDGAILYSGFEKDDYLKVMAIRTSHESDGTPMEDVETAARSSNGKMIGISAFKQYEAAVLEIHQHQVDHNSSNVTREQLKSRRVKELKSLVATRLPRIRKANYEEKISKEINPYLMLNKLGDMEAGMFEVSWSSRTNGMAGLRNRATMLMSLQQVSRGESLFKCELSDLCDFVYHSHREPDPFHFLVMQVFTGKTNKAKTIYGRLIRHRNVNMCGMGALGLYLMLRFELTKELEAMDFTDNSSWFDIKLLVDHHAHSCNFESLSKAVSDQHYATAIKNVANKLGLDPCHFIHFGRDQQPAVLEVEELSSADIKSLGNWGMDVYDDRYSTKMPLKAMRVSAGYEQERGIHFNPRAQVVPPECLKSQVFPGLAVAEEKLATYERTTASLPRSKSAVAKSTARAFIHLLKSLSQVVLQDAALMIHSGRRHVVFDLPVFQTREFLQFQRHVVATVAAAERNNPRDVTLQAAIPLMNQKVESFQAVNAAGFASMNSKQDAVEVQMNTLVNVAGQILGFFHHMGQYQYNPNLFRGLSSIPGNLNQFSSSTSQVPCPSVAVPAQPRTARVSASGAATRYKPTVQYDSVTSIYNEWHGIQPHSGPEGGIVSLKQVHKAQWRSHWDDGLKKRFSRMKFIVTTADSLNNNIGNVSIQNVLLVLDQVFVDQNKSLYKIEAYMKEYREDIVDEIQLMNFAAV